MNDAEGESLDAIFNSGDPAEGNSHTSSSPRSTITTMTNLSSFTAVTSKTNKTSKTTKTTAKNTTAAASNVTTTNISSSEPFDAKKALRNLDENKFMGVAKRIVGEEKYGSVQTHLIKKNMRILALENLLMNLSGNENITNLSSKVIEKQEATNKIMAMASKHAIDAVNNHTQMAVLTRENSKLKAELQSLKTQIDALPSVSATAAAEIASATSAAAEANAQASELRATLEAAIKEKTSEIEAKEMIIATLKLAHEKDRECDRLLAQAELVRTSTTAANKARNEAMAEAALALKTAQIQWDNIHANLQNKLTQLTNQYETTIDELGKLKIAKAKAEEEATLAFNTEQARAIAAEQLAQEYKQKFDACDEKRLKLLDEVMTLKGNIRIFVRVRPLLPSDQDNTQTTSISNKHGMLTNDNYDEPLFQFPDASADCTGIRVVEKPGAGIGGYGVAAEGKKHDFNFQRVFTPTASQADVFSEVEGLVQSALDGHRVCIFAYGQTGSGKTHTMEGGADEERGLIPRSVEYIFTRVNLMQSQGWKVTMTAEMLEIYNENIFDLLVNNTSSSSTSLELRHNPKDDSIIVKGLSNYPVNKANTIYDLLSRARSNRATAATKSNAFSSRSHSVFTLRIQARHELTAQVRSGVLNLIDLAGSERLTKSGAEGETLKETQAINSSLSALSNLIRALHQKNAHLPYRDSKLTLLLKESLTKNSKTMMMCNLNPSHFNTNESLCTLRFAQDVAKVTK